MSTTEILIRLLLCAICWLAGAAVIVPAVAERHGPLAAGLVLVAGTAAVVIAVRWPLRGGEHRG